MIKVIGIHILNKHLQTKLSRSISVINKAKQFLGHNSLHILYCSLLFPYLTYCVEVWGYNYKGFSKSICGVRLWNGLNVELKQCSNINQFKKRYKQMVCQLCVLTGYCHAVAAPSLMAGSTLWVWSQWCHFRDKWRWWCVCVCVCNVHVWIHVFMGVCIYVYMWVYCILCTLYTSDLKNISSMLPSG